MKSDMPMTQKPADSMSMSDDQMKKEKHVQEHVFWR